MSGTEIRQLGPRDASEYQAIFLEALRSAPEAFAADYEQESARSLEEVVERFQREGIYGGFASGRLQAIAAGYGFGLAGVYLVWLGRVVVLYPLCRWFAGVKRRRRDWIFSYL